jgi:hypothetical protein
MTLTELHVGDHVHTAAGFDAHYATDHGTVLAVLTRSVDVEWESSHAHGLYAPHELESDR